MKKSSKSGKNAEKTRRFGEKRRICGKIVQDNATGVLRFDTDTARELRYASSPALCSLCLPNVFYSASEFTEYTKISENTFSRPSNVTAMIQPRIPLFLFRRFV